MGRRAATGRRLVGPDPRRSQGEGVGSLAAKTDKLDARVLAELARRDLVPQVHVSTFADRELKECLGRRMHMVRLRTSAMNRAHGVLSQFGVKLAFDRLRQPDRDQLLIDRGVPEVWRRSVGEAVGMVGQLDERLRPLEPELRPLARAVPRVQLLITIPGVGELLGLTIASEIGDISRFASARRLVGYSGPPARLPVRPEVTDRQAGQVRLNDAALGRDRGGPAGLAPEQPLAPALPRRQGALRRQGQSRQGRRRAQAPHRGVARARAPAALRSLAPAWRGRSCPGELQLRSGRLNGPQGIEQPRQLRPTRYASASAEREPSPSRNPRDPKGRALSQAGFDGGLDSRILSSGEETLRGHATFEEVRR
jgi:hypothetical protein